MFALIFLTTGTLYLLQGPLFVRRLYELGYPGYVLGIIGTAKILGASALLTPKLRRLKEWAYAGFVFDLVGAMWSHLVVQGLNKALPLLVPLTLVTVSYVAYQRLQSHSVAAAMVLGS